MLEEIEFYEADSSTSTVNVPHCSLHSHRLLSSFYQKDGLNIDWDLDRRLTSFKGKVPCCRRAQQIGSTKELPGVSCGAIKAGRPTSGDGTYWIQPVSGQPAFKVWCDMTTDGGGCGLESLSPVPDSQVIHLTKHSAKPKL